MGGHLLKLTIVVILLSGLFVTVIKSDTAYASLIISGNIQSFCAYHEVHVGTTSSQEPSPVTLELSSTTYNPYASSGTSVTVSIVRTSSQGANTFTGYVLESISSNPSAPVRGRFLPYDSYQDVFSCSGTGNTFVTQKKESEPQELPLHFIYLPPLADIGTISFRLTVVHNLTTYWEDIPLEVNLKPEVPDPEPCNGNCLNGGQCVSLPNFNYCICTAGYSGLYCQDGVVCNNNPCYNGGTCAASSSNAAGFTCTCTSDYTGSDCRNVIFCTNNNCLNGGTCIDSSTTSIGFVCVCSPEYTGEICQTRLKVVDACSNEVCQNGGTCQVGVITDQFTCICLEYFYGTYCERAGPCVAEPCGNSVTSKCFQSQTGTHICQCGENDYRQSCTRQVTTERITTVSPATTLPSKPTTTQMTEPTQTTTVVTSRKTTDIITQTPKVTTRTVVTTEKITQTPEKTTTKTTTVAITTRPETPRPETSQITTKLTTVETTPTTIEEVPPKPDPTTKRPVQIDGCTSSPCKNGGTCSVTDAFLGFTCECLTGLIGNTCENRCVPDYCSNGGTCLDLKTQARCICRSGNKGVRCESGPVLNAPITAGNFALMNVWWIVFLALLAIMLTVLIVCLCVSWSRGQRRMAKTEQEKIHQMNAAA